MVFDAEWSAQLTERVGEIVATSESDFLVQVEVKFCVFVPVCGKEVVWVVDTELLEVAVTLGVDFGSEADSVDVNEKDFDFNRVNVRRE